MVQFDGPEWSPLIHLRLKNTLGSEEADEDALLMVSDRVQHDVLLVSDLLILFLTTTPSDVCLCFLECS
jgi:hypothetical protein